MEDIVQRVFSVIFAVLVFFIMPVYMTFEKRDDISYAMALKITTNFVNQVKAKGYLTADMYAKYVSDLGATDNTYEIKLEHRKKVYNPVINVYSYNKDENRDELVDTLDYSIYHEAYENFEDDNTKWEIRTRKYNGEEVTYGPGLNNKLKLTYKLGELIYTEEQILGFLNQKYTNDVNYLKLSDDEYERIDVDAIPSIPITYQKDGYPIYTMGNGDEFNVIIRNTNITVASVLFNTLTFNGVTENLPRVYINYGCIVKNQEYTELSN